METAVDKLEALVRKAENDLNFITCKLEEELSASASKESGIQLNPLKLLQSVQELRKEYQTLVEQGKELQQAHKDACEKLQEEMQAACKKIQEIENKTGVPLSNSLDIF